MALASRKLRTGNPATWLSRCNPTPSVAALMPSINGKRWRNISPHRADPHYCWTGGVPPLPIRIFVRHWCMLMYGHAKNRGFAALEQKTGFGSYWNKLSDQLSNRQSNRSSNRYLQLGTLSPFAFNWTMILPQTWLTKVRQPQAIQRMLKTL